MINLFGEEINESETTANSTEEFKLPPPPKLFDWLNSINTSKEDLRAKDSDLRGYDAFIINKGLMQSQKTIDFAQIMNRLPDIPKEYQYLFLKGAVPPHRAFAKWSKTAKEEKLKDVMAKTGYTKEKALDVIRVLSDKQLELLLEEKGGVKSKRKKK